ncbi:putative selenate reductase subunit YgfK [Clostridium minihomine]|uniref:putative selenate reductase subunit YgfK n=1 Tax=Clostridium minihomine TaxID=2045012 RepID=UPI000C77A762|nr:putative selenate reductase subunit YgfK [Clostridium minihomine]
MSDIMTPIPFGNLMAWVLEEKKKGSCFGLRRAYRADPTRHYEMFGGKLETPIGPAAGPHTQLAQNIIASYYGGSRFFELKTVQKLDGRDLPVSKPCILADDECYNCEWSTELYVPQAFDEYVKAWFVLKVISKEWGLGSPDGFQFNMSVGYDLDGIRTEKVDCFIEGMKDASDTPIFRECKNWLVENKELFRKVTADDIEQMNADICNSVTLSTLHGCPPQEIERIASYLINEKHLNTFIKCNPTLLGYEYARKTLDEMGYDYIQFTDFHFKDDLQYEDAVPMLRRLNELAESKGMSFGVKITNTFPVDVKANELPSEEMYMSGKSLYPLSLAVATRLSRDFDGKLRIAYSGGCDYFNIQSVIEAGIWPVTMATTLLKPGGYTRLVQIAELLMQKEPKAFSGVDAKAVERLAAEAKTDPHHVKPIKPLPNRKNGRKVPLTDCFIAPCMETCPIHQEITTYGRLCKEENYPEALRVILDKNPLPFMTGIICQHPCMSVCTRNFYESPVQIRANKLIAARNGYDTVLPEIKPGKPNGKTVVIVGGGPAGISAAYFLGRAGCRVKVFDENKVPGGVVTNIVPEFRVPEEQVMKDVRLAEAAGAEFIRNTRVEDVKKLMADEKADAAILCIGAHKEIPLKLQEGVATNALHFLREFRESSGTLSLGENVAVVGGGNTAMDTARAAVRNQGVKTVSLVYRRTKRYMPAEEEELAMALEDGVIFRELLAPVAHRGSKLLCRKMKLGDMDASGRRAVIETDETVEVPADTVIASIGERVDGSFYEKNGIEVSEKGFVKVNPATNETSVKGIYAAGDGQEGASVVVRAIAGAKKACEAILGDTIGINRPSQNTEEAFYAKKGNLAEPEMDETQSDTRCLTCDFICENCTEVCPNRANIAIRVPGAQMHQIIHVDYMCNECGNCRSFCPYDSAPYQEKFTLFAAAQDMEDSKNDGFAFTDQQGSVQVRLGSDYLSYTVGGKHEKLPQELANVIDTVYQDYPYLILS